MARRRYISTDISLDPRVNKLAMEYGDFAALLYTWMIPHAADDATLTGDPEQLLFLAMPGRRDKTPDDIAAALAGMENIGLIQWDREEKRVLFPPDSFYKYQTYVQPSKRRSGEQRKTPENAEERREVAENAASPSPSPSPLGKNILSLPPNPPDRLPATGEEIGDSPLDPFFRAWQDAGMSTFPPTAIMELLDYVDKISAENVIDVIRNCAREGKKNWAEVREALAALAGPSSLVAKEEPEAVRPEQVAEIWNEICGDVLPRVQKIPPKRRRQILARAREKDRDEAWWRDYFKRIRGSPFLCGENDRGWRADIDFAVRSEDQVTKVLEGRYDPRPGRDRPLKVVQGGGGDKYAGIVIE